MRKINLKAKNLSSEQGKKGYSRQTSVIVGFILLLVAAVSYGGVFYLKNGQEKKITMIKKDIQNLKSGLDKNMAYKELYDFQDRLLEIRRIAGNKVIQTDVLSQISETTLNESTVQDLKISMDNGQSTIEMTTEVADLNLLAKQLDSYSQVDVNSQAFLKSSSLGEEGVDAAIEFSIESMNNETENLNNKTKINN